MTEPSPSDWDDLVARLAEDAAGPARADVVAPPVGLLVAFATAALNEDDAALAAVLTAFDELDASALRVLLVRAAAVITTSVEMIAAERGTQPSEVLGHWGTFLAAE